MKDAVINLLTLNPLNLSNLVYGFLGGLWLFLLIVTMFSIASQTMHPVGKVAWVLAVVGIPWVGLFLYAIFCLITGDHSWSKRFGK
jgi:uncharacterized membrane protein YhaH (DUF805 family)